MNWNEFIDYWPKRDWVIDLISVVSMFLIVMLVAVVMYSLTLGFIAWSIDGIKPQEPQMPVIERATLQSAPLCAQSCDTSYALQPAVTGQYLNRMR